MRSGAVGEASRLFTHRRHARAVAILYRLLASALALAGRV